MIELPVVLLLLLGGMAIALVVRGALWCRHTVLRVARSYDPVIDGLIGRPYYRLPELGEFDQTLHDRIQAKREELERLAKVTARLSAMPIDGIGEGDAQ